MTCITGDTPTLAYTHVWKTTTALLKVKNSLGGVSEMAISRCNKGISELTKTALSRTSWETFSLICTAEPSLFKPRVNFRSILLSSLLSFRDQTNKLLFLSHGHCFSRSVLLLLCRNRRKFKNWETNTRTHTRTGSQDALPTAQSTSLPMMTNTLSLL